MRMRSAQLVGRGVKLLFAAILVTSLAGTVAIRATHEHGDGNDQRGENRDRDAESPIRHVVVIFQENVSFDHYFATYPHAANTDGSPFLAKAGTPVVNGLFAGGWLDHNPNSTQPFRLSSAQAATCDQGHGYKQEQQSYSFRTTSRSSIFRRRQTRSTCRP